MKIIYDAAKSTSNSKKHGVTLAEADAFEWDAAVLWPDQRKEYGEDRIISLRKANNREVKRYAST